MPSIFSNIINGKIPSYKIAEDSDFIAFLDINPNAEGHTLCVTRQEVDKIFDLEEDTFLRLMAFSRKIALAIEEAVECKRVGIAVIGLEVPHVHVHLIPLNSMANATFQTKLQFSPAQFEATAARIRKALPDSRAL